MKNFSSKQVVGGFVLSAMTLISSGVPVMAQQTQDPANRKIQRKQLKVEQRAQTPTEQAPAQRTPRREKAPSQPNFDVRREQRDIQVAPKARTREPQVNTTRRPIEVPNRTIDRPTQQRRVETPTNNRVESQRTSPRVETQRTSPRVETQRTSPRVDSTTRREPQVRRLSDTQQRQQVDLQRRRFDQYNQRLERQQQIARQRATFLQQQRRLAQYRYQLEYQRRLYEQQQRLAAYRSYNYNNDPFYYTAPQYRYIRSGRSYYVNQYAANLLQEAIQSGYQEGFYAGQADRQDGWRSDYRNSFGYEDANFGYPGYYVDQSEYNYYFREGFRRGYEDGYYSRSRYGSFSGGKAVLLGAVLGTIFTLSALD